MRFPSLQNYKQNLLIYESCAIMMQFPFYRYDQNNVIERSLVGDARRLECFVQTIFCKNAVLY